MIGRILEVHTYSQFWRNDGALGYWANGNPELGLQDFLEQELGNLADAGEVMDFRVTDVTVHEDKGCTAVSWIDKDGQLGQYCFMWEGA